MKPGVASLVVAFLVAWSLSAAWPDGTQAAGNRGGVVGVVFFSSRDCPKCARVDKLLKALARRYPIRVRKFDIDKPRDYELFSRLESIHSDDGFAVPLVMLDETTLMGEDAITRGVEKAIRKLVRKGGAPFPFLGEDGPIGEKGATGRGHSSRRVSSDCDCGRPPTIGEEWRKVRKLIDRLF